MYFIYALYNKTHHKLYIGQTRDVETRIALHKNKTFKNSYTSRFSGNWMIVYTEQVATRQIALRREKELKSYRGREFVKKFIPE